MTNHFSRITDNIHIAAVIDDAIISRDGAITLGWELFPPEEGSLCQKEYDRMTAVLASSIRALPEWTMVHRMDLYNRIRYSSYDSIPSSMLGELRREHFEGREYLDHHCYVFLSTNPSCSGKAGALCSRSPFSRRKFSLPPLDDLGTRLESFSSACSQFVQSISSLCEIPPRRLSTDDLQGIQEIKRKSGNGFSEEESLPGGAGLLQDYLNWFDRGPGCGISSDILIGESGTLERDSRSMIAFSFSRADDLPLEVSNTREVTRLSDGSPDMVFSFGSAFGFDIPYSHIVNMYWLYPSQKDILQEVERRQKNKSAMSSANAENSVGSREIAEFITNLHQRNSSIVYGYGNIIAWGEKAEADSIRRRVGSALSCMGLGCKRNTFDMPDVFLGSMPGAEMNQYEDNFMISELEQALCLDIMDSRVRGIPGGSLDLCDRREHVPTPTDIQMEAFRRGYITNYNAFVLGPSGSGKSFFTAWYLYNCYHRGQGILLVDKGGSYEGLCSVIDMESGRSEGSLYRWDSDHPLSFQLFENYRSWDMDGEENGLGFVMAVIRLIWNPPTGWDSTTDAVLAHIIREFLQWYSRSAESHLYEPGIEDLCQWMTETVLPRITRELSPDLEAMSGDGLIPFEEMSCYHVGDVRITPEKFDIEGLLLSLSPFRLDGVNRDLFNRGRKTLPNRGRLLCYDLDDLAARDENLFRICTFCIIHEFELLMQSSSNPFNILCIDEAWQVIACPETASYLKNLWKTARKYHAGIMVVTQQISDILDNDTVKDAILCNSDVKILLDQSGNASSLDRLQSLLGLSDKEMSLVRSIGKVHTNPNPSREVFISLGGRKSGVYELEPSPSEALAFESDKRIKREFLESLERSQDLSSAIRECLEKRDMAKDNTIGREKEKSL